MGGNLYISLKVKYFHNATMLVILQSNPETIHLARSYLTVVTLYVIHIRMLSKVNEAEKETLGFCDMMDWR